MSCARPVILGVEGQARQLMEEARAGVAIEPENSAALVQAIMQLAADPELRQVLGQNGREYILRHFLSSPHGGDIIRVLEGVLGVSHARNVVAAA